MQTVKILADSIEKLKHELLPAKAVKPAVPKPQLQLEPAAAVAAADLKAVMKTGEEEPESKAAVAPITPISPEERKIAFIHHKQQVCKYIYTIICYCSTLLIFPDASGDINWFWPCCKAAQSYF